MRHSSEVKLILFAILRVERKKNNEQNKNKRRKEKNPMNHEPIGGGGTVCIQKSLNSIVLGIDFIPQKKKNKN